MTMNRDKKLEVICVFAFVTLIALLIIVGVSLFTREDFLFFNFCEYFFYFTLGIIAYFAAEILHG